MAYLRLNTNELHLDVLVGACENYRPKSETKKIVEELQELKDTTEEYLTTNWGSKKTEEYKEIFDTDEKASELWKTYVTDTYKPKLVNIVERVNKVNEEYQKR